MKPYNHELAALCCKIADEYSGDAAAFAAMLDKLTDNNAHQLRAIIERYGISYEDARTLIKYVEG